jgi:hypothetical protein
VPTLAHQTASLVEGSRCSENAGPTVDISRRSIARLSVKMIAAQKIRAQKNKGFDRSAAGNSYAASGLLPWRPETATRREGGVARHDY